MKYPILPAILLAASLLSPALVAQGPAKVANPGQEGQEVKDLSAKLAKGKTNIVDFFSKYCGPCMQISPMLEKLSEKRPDIQVVKLDINRKDVKGIDWQSPLARQYALQSIPHFKIYDGNGKLVSEGDQAYQQIMVWLKSEKLIN